MAEHYDFRAVERKWRERWDNAALYAAHGDGSRPKYYVCEMLPYPSGDLHVGHAKNYTLGDAIARMMRMLGYDVLHPMGWDAFGLPAENAAIARHADPARWTQENIAEMRRQLRLLGTSYDWSREITTCLPGYYRWNQWLFLRLYESGLAYKREAPVNWCPHDRTVLANEQVVDGRCWRCEHLVERRNLSQWFLKITQYADRLLHDLDELSGWPERTKTMQRNWIGRSTGVDVVFAVEGTDDTIATFTTRADTLFGVTYLAIAPEHPIVARLARIAPERADAVGQFAASLLSKSELERTSLMEKQGLFTGAYAINPLSRERIPIWVTNYVVADYGTGAVMGVPAHDQRDFEFAKRHGLPVARVVVPADAALDAPAGDAAFVEDGRLVASGDFSEMSSERARDAIAAALAARGAGGSSVKTRLRDWLVSRQRYWGTPIPIVYCAACGEVPVPDDALPVVLPLGVPIGGEGSPLANLASFVDTVCPRCGGPARRETDTMDTFFESSWYYLRYLDPHDGRKAWEPADARTWMNVDQYVGGAEHAVLHLLYARFFYKFFHDRGWVEGRDEPFERLFHQGMLLANGEKISKSRGNVIGIDRTAETSGVDAMRLFVLYVTPPEDTSDWTEEGISGRVRFVNRVWRACAPFFGGPPCDVRTLPPAEDAAGKALLRAVHVAAKSAVEETISRRFHYNATIARFDELVNALTAAVAERPQAAATRYAAQATALLLAPFAPHLAEELWERFGYETSVHLERYLEPDERALSVDTITLVVQINGKVRARLSVEPGIAQEQAIELALADPNVRAQLDGREPLKRIFVPDKLLNLVVPA
ncbi:MAG TPA: leucine--tRNA ligase [Candidatus Tumulicola sp.]|nr:leucine--tRNA ligase [Candidatus Tumulicola sp.]